MVARGGRAQWMIERCQEESVVFRPLLISTGGIKKSTIGLEPNKINHHDSELETRGEAERPRTCYSMQ
jgi:hypothetical protein